MKLKNSGSVVTLVNKMNRHTKFELNSEKTEIFSDYCLTLLKPWIVEIVSRSLTVVTYRHLSISSPNHEEFDITKFIIFKKTAMLTLLQHVTEIAVNDVIAGDMLWTQTQELMFTTWS